MYFQRFKHVHFVDLMWPLGAPGPALGGFGGPWERQGWSWGAQGGAKGEMIRPWDAPGGPEGPGAAPRGA